MTIKVWNGKRFEVDSNGAELLNLATSLMASPPTPPAPPTGTTSKTHFTPEESDAVELDRR